jgi:heptosyltransferase-2
MADPRRVVVLHTAFIGDIILALPIVQALRSAFPKAHIAFVAVPASAGVLHNHPAIDQVIEFDKRGNDRGVTGVFRLARRLRREEFDTAIVPHRSLRSAIIVALAGIPLRIGFSTSTGRALYSKIVQYRKNEHETFRNLGLLNPLGFVPRAEALPCVYPGEDDRRAVDQVIAGMRDRGAGVKPDQLLALAPGSVWFTKRWPREYFERLTALLLEEGFTVVLIGGPEDEPLCRGIEQAAQSPGILNAAGKLTLLQSAELIRRCAALVSNDSAPMHLAVAVRTPVVAIFGATIPGFGFAPMGPRDLIAETSGLPCRPCSIHGGDSCPIGTLECMHRITPEDILSKIHSIVQRVHAEP